jgi:WD40 repeat protein
MVKLISRVWDVHNGECLRTIILSNSPPVSVGKFTKTSDCALLASLNSKISLVDTKTSKVMREYAGHMNNEYIVEMDFSKNSRGDIDGFFIGSENGLVHRFSLLSQSPISSLPVSDQGQTADLLIVKNQCLYVSGRSWASVHRIAYSPAG